MSINRVFITGNLTWDPEVRMVGTQPLCKMGVAVNDRRKNNDTGEWEDYANFFNVIMWGARGEYWARNLTKGSRVAVSGRLRWSSWTTNEGDKRSKIEIIADDIESLGPHGEATPSDATSADSPASPEPPVPVEVLDEEIPF